MATDFVQSTERMCETMWVRCIGAASDDWVPFQVFDKLRKTSFHPRKWKHGHVVEVEDGSLLGFAVFTICKFLGKRVLGKTFR